MNKTLATALKVALFLGFGIFLIWLVFNSFTEEDKTNMMTSLKGAKYIWLVPSLFCAFLSHYSRALRWRQMLSAMNETSRVSTAVSSVFIGYLANLAVPRLGEISRCGVLSRYDGVPFEKAFGTVITERLVDVLFLAVITTVAVLSQFSVIGAYFQDNLAALSAKYAGFFSADNWMMLLALLVFGLLGLGLALFLWRKLSSSGRFSGIRDRIVGVFQGIGSIAKLDNVPLFIFHSLFIWFMYYCMIYICFQTMDITANLSPMVGLAVLAFGSFAIIATQGGIGAYPLIVAGLLALYGIDKAEGYAFGWIIWSAQTLFLIVAGAIALASLSLIKKHEGTGLDTSQDNELGSIGA